jgi:hypothetical protein
MDQPSQNRNLSSGQPSGDGKSMQQSQWSGEQQTAEKGISDLGKSAKDTAQGLLDPLRDRAMSLANEQKDSGLEHLDSVARAVQTAANEMSETLPEAAGYVRNMADGIERFSSSLKERTFEELIGEVDSFARRQPLAFFGACIFMGFMATRFLKSAEAKTQQGGDGLDRDPPGRASGEELGYGAP